MKKGVNVGSGTDLFPGGQRTLWPSLATPLPRFRGFPAALTQCSGAGVRMVGQRAEGTQAAC